ncbi:MAG: nucleotide pyrophosphohydrolase [Gammaproteobacteria bacterium]|nr:MAG: nucleotide pyrophosphohydrolase [Gammaproteobacteria bacterium]
MKLSELQSYIKEFDHAPELPEHYFLKLVEEIGELSESIRNGSIGQASLDNLKGSIAEELYDVNLEQTHELKEILNKVKYNR